MPDLSPADEVVPAESQLQPSCWRCGLVVSPQVSTCSHCGARLSTGSISSTAPAPSPAKNEYDSFNLLFKSYIILLATGIIHAFVQGFTVSPKHGGGLDPPDRSAMFTQIAVVETIDTIVIFWAVYAAWGLMPRPSPPLRTRIVAWLVALPALAALLTLNFGYHALIRQIVHQPLISDEMMSQFDLIAFLTICVQPAIVEEAYCRLFALDCLRRPLATHAAVWILASCTSPYCRVCPI